MDDARRRCGFCGDGELRPIRDQALRGFGRETTWQCGGCGLTVKLLSPGGRVLLAGLALFMMGAAPCAAVSSRIARESERGWIVALLAALALGLTLLFVRDAGRQRRHPPAPGAPGGGPPG